ncbi:asparagine synthase-related protein [Ruminococcus flavefaciens]|uniref:asparagine synthase-related protein n=1 Tax=Ruminococcus flavefaciens TaxID=1265 RepID=UPI00048E2F39|nr:asparagine synthase-related protein [Ruminococcus flavefaciens]
MESKNIKEFTLGTSGNKKLMILNKDSYTFRDLGNKKLYYPEKYDKEIENNIEKMIKLEKESLITDLQDRFLTGVFALEVDSDWIIFGPFLDTSLSYCKTESEILISDSAFDIAYKKQFKVSKSSISAYLVTGLPFEPFSNMSFWDEISKINPFRILKISSGNITECEMTNAFKVDHDIDKVTKDLRDTIISNIYNQNSQFDSVSCDVSGGVDSASIAYVVNKISGQPMIFHAESDESANSDTKWAQYIADDLRIELNKLPSIDKNSSRFSVDKEYIGSNVPDSPLLWGDTEGYVKEMLCKLPEKDKHLHMIGIGGDELFTYIPSVPWSIIREEGVVRSIPLIFKYCILSRRSFLKCIKDLTNKTSLKDEVKQSIDNGFGSKKKNKRQLSWSEDVIFPSWLTDSAKESAHSKINSLFSNQFYELSDDRSHYQRIQSILFQKEIFSQIVHVAGDEIGWYAPFLDAKVIKTALTLPSRYCTDPQKTKPMLYEALKGIVPLEVFTRGVKGDYSSAFYNDYRAAAAKWMGKTKEFFLSKLDVINHESLDRELSMPSSNFERVDFFMRVCNIERWLRQVNKYIEIGV